MLSLKRCQKETRGLLKYISLYLEREHKNTLLKCCHQTDSSMYGANIWTWTSKENPNNIFRLQKRVARIILDAESGSCSLPLFKTLNWFPFHQDAYVNKCTYILKRTLGKTPEYLKSMLQLNSYVKSRSTRFSKLNLRCSIYNYSTEEVWRGANVLD